jgi:hypothetical protein
MVMSDTILREGIASDWLFIDSLRKREGSALGFLPKDTYCTVLENRPLRVRDMRAYKTNRIIVTEDNGDLTGYAYYTMASDWLIVVQIVVQEDARRWYRAMLMINEIEDDANRYGKHGVTARVAYDLESNFFWRAIGYVPIKQITSTWLNQKESKSKRPLWIYRKEIGGLFTDGQQACGNVEMSISLEP